MDPFTPVAATINSSLRIFEVTYQLKAVDEQTADLLQTTRHVDTNLNEARRLRRVKDSLLNSNERSWIDGIIDDTEDALRAIARLIEPARIDKATKEGISFGNRFLWVFRDNPQVRDKHARLSLCHQSLTAIIGCLYSKDVVVISPVQEKKKGEYLPPYDSQLEDLLNWRNRRRRTKSSMDLRSMAAESSMPIEPSSQSTIVASHTSNVPAQGDDIDQNRPVRNLYSAVRIHEDTHHTPSNPTRDLTRRPLLSDAAPTQGALIGPVASFVKLCNGDGKSSMSVDGVSPSKLANNPTREAIIRQRQADEHAANSRLPYPMSPSDYVTNFASTPEQSDSTFDSKAPLFSDLELPQFDGDMPNLNTAGQASGTRCPNDIGVMNKTPPPYPQRAIDSRLPVSTEASDSCFNGADGLQLRSARTKSVDLQYRHPPFAFSSFAPLSLPENELERTRYMRNVCDVPTEPAYEGLQLVADLETSGNVALNEDQNTSANIDGLVEDPKRSPPVSPGRLRRGGRSWLLFHASRSDFGQHTG